MSNVHSSSRAAKQRQKWTGGYRHLNQEKIIKIHEWVPSHMSLRDNRICYLEDDVELSVRVHDFAILRIRGLVGSRRRRFFRRGLRSMLSFPVRMVRCLG